MHWLILGITIISSIGDTIYNLIVIPPVITYSGTVFIVLGLGLGSYTLSKNPIRWVSEDGITIYIKSFNFGTWLAAAGLIIALWFPRVFGSTIPAPTPTAECRAWNLSFDFRTYPSQENPNRDSCGNKDVWYFLESGTLERETATYSLIENFVANAFGIPGYQQWQGDYAWQNRQNIYLPSIGINTTDETKTIETAIHPSKTIAVHPFDDQSLIIVGWRSPVTSNVSISGFVNDLDNHGGDGILWFIDKGNQNLASGSIGDGGEEAFLDVVDSQNLRNIAVSKGEFVYFIVHPNQNDKYDTTQIDIQIRLP